jgi:hypothetical protein
MKNKIIIKLNWLLAKYKDELELIRADMPEDVREGRHPINKPYDEDTAMLCGAEDQLQMVVTDLELLIKEIDEK